MINKKSITFLTVVTVLIVMIIGANIISGTSKTSMEVEATNTKIQPEYIEKMLNKDKVAEVNIIINQTDWKWLIENATKKEPRSCDITINGTTFYNVAISPKGNSSLTTIASDDTTDRFSFKLDFGAYVEGQTYFGLRKIALNNMMSDKSYMKEAISYDLFDFMGVATPSYTYSNIKLNGEDWGLYLAVEVIEESFVEREFGTTKGNLYKPESMDMGGDNAGGNARGAIPNNPNGQKNVQVPNAEGKQQFPNMGNEAPKARDGKTDKEVPNAENKQAGGGMNIGGMMGSGKGANLKYTGDLASDYSTIQESAVFKSTSDKDFEKVIDMIKNLNEGTNLEKYLDVEEVLRFFAVNTFLVNLDGYAGGMYHNYYLYEKDGLFKIIPWDLNMSFAGFRMTDGTKAINFPIDTPITGKLEDAPLIGKLLEVPKYKELYHSYLKEISEKYISSGVYENSITKTDKLINSYVKKDISALYTYEEYSKSIPIMVTFGVDRAKSIDAQLKGTQPSTTYGTITTTVNLSSLGGMEMGGKGMPGDEVKVAGDKKAAMPDMKGIPDMGSMQSVMKILEEADGKELTVMQKESLKTYGVDEAMINNLKGMVNGGGFPPVGVSGSPSKIQIGIIALSTALLLVGLLFVFKFKRRRFRSS